MMGRPKLLTPTSEAISPAMRKTSSTPFSATKTSRSMPSRPAIPDTPSAGASAVETFVFSPIVPTDKMKLAAPLMAVRLAL